MTVAVAHPSGHSSRANRWLLAAVIVLAGALVALGVWALVHGETEAVAPAATTQQLDARQVEALLMERQDVENTGDAAGLARFYSEDAVFWDGATGARFVGGQEIARELTAFVRDSGLLYRADGAPTVIGDRFVIVPFSLVEQKDMDKRTGRTMRVNVFEIEDGKIVREWAPALY